MKNYLNDLKVAVINQDLKKLEEIIDLTPEFNSIEEAKEIQAYLKEAIKILENEKNKLSNEMKKIKNIQKFNNEQIKKKETFNFKA
ncbi:hypothetical protein [Nautilia lithotrophica]